MFLFILLLGTAVTQRYTNYILAFNVIARQVTKSDERQRVDSA